MFVERIEEWEYYEKFEVELTRGVLQLSRPDFLETLRIKRQRYGRIPKH